MKYQNIVPLALVFMMSAVVGRAQAHCAAAEPIELTSVSFSTQSGTAEMVGYSEYTNPSAAPKKYRRQDLGGSGQVCFMNGTTCSGSIFGTDCQELSGFFQFSATTGLVAANTQKVDYRTVLAGCNSSVSTNNTAALGQILTIAASGEGGQTINSTRTRVEAYRNGCIVSGGTSLKYVDKSGATGLVGWWKQLSDEDTEEDAEKRVTTAGAAPVSTHLPPIPPDVAVPAAYRTDRGNGFTWAFTKVRYEAEFTFACAGEYDMVVTYSTKMHSAPFTAGKDDIQILRKTLEPRAYKLTGEIRVKEVNTDYTLTRIEIRKPCDALPPGTPDFEVNSIHVELSMGLGAKQESAGFLRLEADNVTAALYSPAALLVATPDANTTSVIRSSGVPRQVKAPQALADIVTLDASSYEVRFYSPGQVGAQDPGTKIYAVSGTPYATFKFENPDAAQSLTERLRVTETRGSLVRVNEYGYAAGTNTWSLSRGNDLRKESLAIVVSGADTTKTSTIRESDNTVVSKTRKTYHLFAWGEELVSEVLDPDGVALTTTSSFYDNSSTDGANYGRLKLRTNADGSWERHTWDATGRPLKTVRPFLDAVSTAADNLCRVTENAYSTLADVDGDSLVDQLTTTIETTLGTETGRSYLVEWSRLATLASESFTRRSDIRCATAVAAWNAADNLVTETLIYPSGTFAGRTRRTLNPDGTATLTSYTLDANGQQFTTAKAGVPNVAKDDITDGTRTVTVTSAQGQTVGQTATDIASNLTLSSWTATQFDAVGRPTRMDFTDGTYETRDYACCGLASSRDRTGLVSSYQYDALGRQTHATRNGLTTRSAYDADGRVKSVTRIGSDSSEILQGSSTYDLAGRQTERRDALNRLTTFAQTFDGGTGHTTRTTTNPDAGTAIEVSARDGSRLSVSGAAAAPRNYEYDLESGKLFTKETRVGEGGATTEWVKTYTDFAGRYCKTVYADSATAESFYNAIGQLTRQVDPDGVTTLFAYNARGEQETIAIDLNANNTIDLTGTDRITKTVNSVATRDTYTVLRSTSSVWETDGADTPVTVSISEQSADGLRSWQTVRGPQGLSLSNGLTTTSVTVLAGSGSRTVTTTAPDGTTSTQVYADDRLSSTTVKTAADVQLGAVTYSYDPHGRLATSSQLSTLNSQLIAIYTHFDDDNIHTVTTPDPDPNRSGPGYDPQMTTYAYDLAGRVNIVMQPDGGIVTTEYYPTGAVKKISGVRTYPEERTYDSQGRPKNLKTWKDHANNTGAAVITWNYDPQRGFLLNKRYADNSGPTYTYYPSGRLQTRVWARGITTTYTHNAAGDLAAIDYSDATPDVAITYDRLGRPKTRTDGSGVCAWTYHASGQPEDEAYTSGLLNGISLDRSFDSLARLSGVSAASVPSVTYSYDAASRLDTVTSGANSATYGYLANSPLVESVVFKHGTNTRLTTAKVYDNLNRLGSISSAPSASSAVSAAYAYNAANQRTKLTREDNRYWGYGYDSLGQVTAAKKYLSGGTAMLGHDFSYTFDDIGNRKTAFVNSQISSYASNLLNQYEQRTIPGAIDVLGAAQADATVTVTHPATTGSPQATARQDELFYRQLTGDNSTAVQFPAIKITGVKNNVGANGEDAVTEVIRNTLVTQTPETFIHDADGNLTDDARWHYAWDGENRLIAMETVAAAATAGVPNQKLEFTYDGQSRRIAKKVYDWNIPANTWELRTSLRFVYDGWNLLAEVNDSGAAVRSYTWGLDLSGSLQGAGGVGGLLFASNLAPSSSLHAPCFDGNGNVIAYVDMASGAQSATYEYNAFGETIISDGVAAAANPFRFSTKYTDTETGHLYYGLRYYTPSTGRWLSRDPLDEEGGGNLYGYCANNPINRIDPLGLWSPLAHDYLLDYAFRTRAGVSREKIEIMQASSRAFDLATAVGVSFANMHSMKNEWQTSQEAKVRRDAFIMRRINRARELRKACREKEAHEVLGQAFHAVMDSTSPEHIDEWGNLKIYRGTRDLLGHSAGEDYLIGRLPILRGHEDAKDLTTEIYYRNSGLLNAYYNLYLRD